MTGVEAYIAEEPLFCVAKGAGIIFKPLGCLQTHLLNKNFQPPQRINKLRQSYLLFGEAAWAREDFAVAAFSGTLVGTSAASFGDAVNCRSRSIGIEAAREAVNFSVGLSFAFSDSCRHGRG